MSQVVTLNVTISTESREHLSELMKEFRLRNLNVAVETLIDIVYGINLKISEGKSDAEQEKV